MKCLYTDHEPDKRAVDIQLSTRVKLPSAFSEFFLHSQEVCSLSFRSALNVMSCLHLQPVASVHVSHYAVRLLESLPRTSCCAVQLLRCFCSMSASLIMQLGSFSRIVCTRASTEAAAYGFVEDMSASLCCQLRFLSSVGVRRNRKPLCYLLRRRNTACGLCYISVDCTHTDTNLHAPLAARGHMDSFLNV